MSPEEFVRALADVAPDVLQLSRVGIVGEAATKWRHSYRCVARESTAVAGRDCAVALVDDWDASSVVIAVVRFDGQSSRLLLGTRIGLVEVDPLLVDNASGEVIVVDHQQPNHVMWPVAADGARLLDALLLAARFCTRLLLSEVDDEDFVSIRAAALECADAAGGERYKDFYWMLLGAEP
jgi:hypothetical protein